MKNIVKTASLAAALAFVNPAQASTNLLTNADFSSHPNLESFSRAVGGDIATGWTVSGFGNGGIIDVIATKDLNSTPNQSPDQSPADPGYSFWNTTNGGATVITPPPGGGAYVLGQDSASENDAYISQTLSGLKIGQTYAVSFDWAGVQLRFPNGTLWNGPTNERWQVNEGGTYNGAGSQSFIGGATETTDVIQVASHGFTGWEHASLSFVAQSSSEAFNLQAVSTSTGLPPFALLSDLSVSAVPEPSTWAMMIVGFGCLGVIARRRRRVLAAA